MSIRIKQNVLYQVKVTVVPRLKGCITCSKGPFNNYARVMREGGVGKISTYAYFFLGKGSQTYSYGIFSKSIFYIRNRGVKLFGRDHISFI